MEYKVGDKVIVRTDLEVDTAYGIGYIFNSEMAKFAGKTVTIKSIYSESGYYKIEEDWWYWVDEMFIGKIPDNIIDYYGEEFQDKWTDFIASQGCTSFCVTPDKLENCDYLKTAKQYLKTTNFGVDTDELLTWAAKSNATITVPGVPEWVEDLLDRKKTDKATEYESYKMPSEYLDRKEENEMEILDLYRIRKQDKILEEFREEYDKEIEDSKLFTIKKELETIAKERLLVEGFIKEDDEENEYKKYIYIVSLEDKDKTLQEKLKETEEGKEKKLRKLTDEIKEIRALLEPCETYDQKMQVLKNYNIIDEGGKLVEI